MKTCPACKHELPESKFYKNAGRPDGVSVRCKACYRKYESSPERRAKRTWNTLHCRVRLQPAYKGIEVRMTRDEFLRWAIPAYREFSRRNRRDTPSLDRVDPDKHYEIGNLRIIARGENARLTRNHLNVHAPDGMGWCGACKKYLPLSDFWKDNRAYNRRQKRCKPCQSEAIRLSEMRVAQRQKQSPR